MYLLWRVLVIHSLHCVCRLLPSKVWLSELHLVLLFRLLHAHRLSKCHLVVATVVLVTTIHEIVIAILVMASKARVIHASTFTLHAHLLTVLVPVVVVLVVAMVATICCCRAASILIVVV